MIFLKGHRSLKPDMIKTSSVLHFLTGIEAKRGIFLCFSNPFFYISPLIDFL